jgi:hypothetical protein
MFGRVSFPGVETGHNSCFIGGNDIPSLNVPLQTHRFIDVEDYRLDASNAQPLQLVTFRRRSLASTNADLDVEHQTLIAKSPETLLLSIRAGFDDWQRGTLAAEINPAVTQPQYCSNTLSLRWLRTSLNR